MKPNLAMAWNVSITSKCPETPSDFIRILNVRFIQFQPKAINKSTILSLHSEPKSKIHAKTRINIANLSALL